MRLSRIYLALAAILLAVVPSIASASNTGFGFNARTISGFPTGAVFLTGGGAFDLSADFAQSGGGFRCTSTVSQGPLSGCLAGQGVRWDTVDVLASTPFTCTGADAEKTAFTDADTVVLLADFYRAGDGVDESFTAKMIVSETDIAPDIAGDQTVWVQGVGCSTAIVNFSAQ